MRGTVEHNMRCGSRDQTLQPTFTFVWDYRIGAHDDHGQEGQEKPAGDDSLYATMENAVPLAATNWAQAVS